MTIEALPHLRKTDYLGKKRLIVEKSPDCPEELNPYGEVPIECEMIKPEIEKLRLFFQDDNLGDVGWSKGRPSPEGLVSITAGRDDSERKALIVDISFPQPTVDENEALRRIVQRYCLYPNNIGTYKNLEHVFREYRDEDGKVVLVNEETIASQGFIEEIHLEMLKYARLILERMP